LSISEDEEILCSVGKDTVVIMALSAIALPLRGDENLVAKGLENAPKVIRQFDIEGGKTMAKVISPVN
jgi:hypothetical protein